MKVSLLLPVLVVLSLPIFASERLDPRIFEVMRKEQSLAQSFCFSFLDDGIRSGHQVEDACLEFTAQRYFGNYGVATKADADLIDAAAITRAQTVFCASLHEYSKPGTSVRADCAAWNRARGELFALGTTEGAAPAGISAKIAKVEKAHRKFCQSLRDGGDEKDAELFGARGPNCLKIAKLATATDRAVLLGEVPKMARKN